MLKRHKRESYVLKVGGLYYCEWMENQGWMCQLQRNAYRFVTRHEAEGAKGCWNEQPTARIVKLVRNG